MLSNASMSTSLDDHNTPIVLPGEFVGITADGVLDALRGTVKGDLLAGQHGGPQKLSEQKLTSCPCSAELRDCFQSQRRRTAWSARSMLYLLP